MQASFPFLWVIPSWCVICSAYFLCACYLLWKKIGVNMWTIWWQTRTNNLQTERRFADEIRRFPK
jgi:hypothetical protein